jgi:hypothetical protein
VWLDSQSNDVTLDEVEWIDFCAFIASAPRYCGWQEVQGRPCTLPLAVSTLPDSDARTASRPASALAGTLLAATTARTRSPVRTSPTTPGAVAAVVGNPCASVRP